MPRVFRVGRYHCCIVFLAVALLLSITNFYIFSSALDIFCDSLLYAHTFRYVRLHDFIAKSSGALIWIREIIHDGPFSTVYRSPEPGQTVVKLSIADRKFAKEPHDIHKEIRALSTICCPNVGR